MKIKMRMKKMVIALIIITNLSIPNFAVIDWEMKEVSEVDYENGVNLPKWAKEEVMYIHQLDKLHNKNLRIMPNDYAKPINRWEFTVLIMNAVYTLGQNAAHRETGLWIYDAGGYTYRKGFTDPVKMYKDILQLEQDNLEYGSHRMSAITDAQVLGIVNGKSADRFNPYDYLTRQEAAKIMLMALVNSVNSREYRGGASLDFNYHKAEYNDYEEVSTWAKPYVDMMYMLEIFKGDENGNFNPKDNISYAEAHKIVYLYIAEKIKFDNLERFFVPYVSGRTVEFNTYLENYPAE